MWFHLKTLQNLLERLQPDWLKAPSLKLQNSEMLKRYRKYW